MEQGGKKNKIRRKKGVTGKDKLLVASSQINDSCSGIPPLSKTKVKKNNVSVLLF